MIKSRKILDSLLTKINKYLSQKNVNEILLNEPGIVKLDIQGKWEFVKDRNITAKLLIDLPHQLAVFSNQQFGIKVPTLATSIPDTSYRIQAVNSTILQSQYNLITIRRKLDINFILENFTDDKKKIELISKLIKENKNILISGGTSSGKTTLLNVMIKLIPIEDRIVTLEDSPELEVPHKNKDQLLVSKTGSDIASVSYEDMINVSMRLRPDRLLLGEIDTRNTLAFLRLANTGHDGMISTIHASSTNDSITALIMNIQFTGIKADKEIITTFMKSAIDYIIQIKKIKGKRQITDIKSLKEILNKKQIERYIFRKAKKNKLLKGLI